MELTKEANATTRVITTEDPQTTAPIISLQTDPPRGETGEATIPGTTLGWRSTEDLNTVPPLVTASSKSEAATGADDHLSSLVTGYVSPRMTVDNNNTDIKSAYTTSE